MIVSVIFFALIAVFVITAVRAARESAVSPASEPGNLLQAEDGSGERMNTTAFICTCADWQRNRSRFVRGTPMRLCRHLVGYYARHLTALPESLHSRAPIISLLGMEGQGMPCGVGTEYGHLDGTAYVIYVVNSAAPRARLVLGSRRYEFDIAAGTWLPEPPRRSTHFAVRARQLASAAFQTT